MPKKEEIEELKKILIEPKPETETASIIYDGKQFTVRIPKRFAEVMLLDPSKDKFEFTLKRPSPKEYQKMPELTGRVIKG